MIRKETATSEASSTFLYVSRINAIYVEKLLNKYIIYVFSLYVWTWRDWSREARGKCVHEKAHIHECTYVIRWKEHSIGIKYTNGRFIVAKVHACRYNMYITYKSV